jgi:hypothetical protein
MTPLEALMWQGLLKLTVGSLPHENHMGLNNQHGGRCLGQEEPYGVQPHNPT